MKKLNSAFRLMLSGLLIIGGSITLFSQVDDPNLDRIPEDFLLHQENRSPMLSTVYTIDGYDNYYLGIDFAEGHISENPLAPGEYFTAFNIDEPHYTTDGYDWFDSNVAWGGYTIRGDPVTAYDGDGNLYYESMYGSPSGCVIVKSTDNGQTWSSSVVAISGVDKNWLAADQTDGPYADYVYTTMTRSGGGNFARSTDQGDSFTTTFQPGTQSLPGMMVCVGAWNATDGGAVYVVTNSGSAFASTYSFYQSLDGGATFSLKSQQSFANYVGSNVNNRNSVSNMRTRPYPFITADNSNGTYRGRLYLIYASNEPAGNGNNPDIFCRYSDDGGTTWSSDITVNDDPDSEDHAQWHPATWCDYETGRLYVQWMDTRDVPTTDSALIYASYSDDGGQTFVENHAISNEKMKINCNTCGGGGTPRYLGDYNAIVSNEVTSMSTWADFRDGNFKSLTAYFPDYAMEILPAIGTTSGGTASFTAEVPSIKGWTEDITFSVIVETPASGSFNIDFPNGATLSSFPGSLPIEISVVGGVPEQMYDLTLTGTGPNGTPVHIRTAIVNVVAGSAPTADFEASETIFCAGKSTDFTDLSSEAPTSWLWTFDGGTPSTSTDQNPLGIVYFTPGMYDVTLEATNSVGSNSHTKLDYIEVMVSPPAPVSSDQEVCVGDTVPDLIATGTMIQWYSDPDLLVLVHAGDTFSTGETGPGIYFYYVTQTGGGCESLATMVTLTIHNLPSVAFTPIPDVCLNDAAFALSGGLPSGGTYSGPGVSGGMFDPVVAGLGTHTLMYEYTDGNTCTNSDSQTITVNDYPHPDLGPDYSVCSDESVILDATTVGATAYEWYPGGETTASITVDTAGYGLGTHMFIVYVTDGNICRGSDTVMVEFQDCTGIGELAGIEDINLYPNPGQGEFSLQINTKKSLDLNIKVYNNRGVAVYEEQDLRIDNSGLVNIDLTSQPSGIYMVTVYNKQGRWIEKLIIRK